MRTYCENLLLKVNYQLTKAEAIKDELQMKAELKCKLPQINSVVSVRLSTNLFYVTFLKVNLKIGDKWLSHFSDWFYKKTSLNIFLILGMRIY